MALLEYINFSSYFSSWNRELMNFSMNEIKFHESFHLNLELTLIGMRQGGFTPLIIYELDFVSWMFIKNF